MAALPGSADPLAAPSPGRARLWSRVGVRGRLLLAFLCITALSALGAAVALHSFREIDEALSLITQRRVPETLEAQEVARRAERIVAAAPALLTVETQDEKEIWSQRIIKELSAMNRLLESLRTVRGELGSIKPLEADVQQLQENLRQLDDIMNDRLSISATKRQRLQMANSLAGDLQALLVPWVSVMDERIAQWGRLARDESLAAEDRRSADLEFERSLTWFRALQTAQVLGTAVGDLFQRAATAEDATASRVSAFRIRQSLDKIEALANQFDPKLGNLLSETIEELRPYAVGATSIPTCAFARLS